MARPMIVVFGATGTIGSELVPLLLKARQRVRIAVRDPAKASRFAEAEVVRADLSDPASLAAACAGAHKVFVVSAGEGIALEPNVFDAARAAGAEHIVRVSGLEIEFPELAVTPLGRWHLETERRLRNGGVPWTLLRPSYFSSNTRLPFVFDRREDAALLPTDDGKEAPVDPHDIAAVAVAALTAPGHEGETYLLTGPELLSFGEMMAKLSAVLGRTIGHVAVTEDDAYQRLLTQGVPPPYAQSLLGHFRAVRAGRAYLTSTVSRLLGRPARSFDDWLLEHAAEFQDA